MASFHIQTNQPLNPSPGENPGAGKSLKTIKLEFIEFLENFGITWEGGPM